MGNLVDSIEAEDPPTDSDSEPSPAIDIVIDLDAPEYHEYLQMKRKSLSEGALLNDINYLQWKKINNGMTEQQRTPKTKHRNCHEKVVKRRSTPITGNELIEVKPRAYSEECHKRSIDSKQRIDDTRKKYHLGDRDYSARTYVWSEEDEQQVKKDREQRKLVRQQIRIKYNLPTPVKKFHRTTAIATG
ncbi:hypothetical protein OS493_007982 [Desmophyllum pertusum]|uniref:Uncharacterized protein n=1 Tax=Desmophyllum pertusum TaxID=174260 RepID=A0A9W9YGH1_9CNID|nr:hypothetical protein OS493_007982 [Desmophyllum pertusum]